MENQEMKDVKEQEVKEHEVTMDEQEVKEKEVTMDEQEVNEPEGTETKERKVEEVMEMLKDLVRQAKEKIDEKLKDSNSSDEKVPFIRGTENGFEVNTVRIKEAFKVLGGKISDAFASCGQAIARAHEEAVQAEELQRKTEQLAKMLPYMTRNETHEIVEAILNGDLDFTNIDINILLPHITEEDCRALFEKSLAENDKVPGIDDVFLSCVPYVNEDALTLLVDRYVAGGYQDIDMEYIYPYLSAKDVKRVFCYNIVA